MKRLFIHSLRDFPKRSARAGFTLLEILLVVAAIGILASIVLIALNPSEQLGRVRNAQRKVDLNTILNAIYQYSIDNNGDLPADLTGIEGDPAQEICRPGEICGGVALDELTDLEQYLVDIPVDPSCSDSTSTCYEIEVTDYGRIRVSAPLAQNEVDDINDPITATR